MRHMAGESSEGFMPLHGRYAGLLAYIETRPAEIVASILVCLIHHTNYLLDQLIRRLEKDFLAEGGLRERMARARLAHRAKK